MAYVSDPGKAGSSELRPLGIVVALLLGLVIVATIIHPAPWVKELASFFAPEEKSVYQQDQPVLPVGTPVSVCTSPYSQSATGPCLNE